MEMVCMLSDSKKTCGMCDKKQKLIFCFLKF